MCLLCRADFYSPLSLKAAYLNYEVFCVDFGNECTAPNVGNGVGGTYSIGLNAGSVTGLTPNSTYSCYVATIARYGAVCSNPTYVYTKTA